MRRSLLEFHRAMPHVTMIPHPVFPEGFRAGEWWRWPGTLNLLISEYTKFLAAGLSQMLGIRAPVTVHETAPSIQQSPAKSDKRDTQSGTSSSSSDSSAF
jgi:hypothetical protein